MLVQGQVLIKYAVHKNAKCRFLKLVLAEGTSQFNIHMRRSLLILNGEVYSKVIVGIKNVIMA